MRIGCPSSTVDSRTTRRASSPTSVGLRWGCNLPRSIRSRSRRSSIRRFILRPLCSITWYRLSFSSSVRCRSSSRRIVCIAPMMPASGPFRSCETACNSVSFTSFISRRSLERSASTSTRSHCASMIERSVSSSIANARNTANRTIAFQYGTGSVCSVAGRRQHVGDECRRSWPPRPSPSPIDGPGSTSPARSA